ncbi:MAG TPA: hypothetical protein VHK89_06150 [Actinomycetota bacterium]|nr:hypothetical protein [Actinomycetota bacterium]
MFRGERPAGGADVDGRGQAHILWVRCCPRCLRIDHRRWFEEPAQAAEGEWSCDGCGGPDYSLLRTRW